MSLDGLQRVAHEDRLPAVRDRLACAPIVRVDHDEGEGSGFIVAGDGAANEGVVV